GPRAIEIALATALTESGLRNLANSKDEVSLSLPNDGVGQDHDSVGPFQQRPSWGSTRERMTPMLSAGKFYDQLVKVHGYESMPITVAAQTVQRSAFPDAYAKYADQAAAVYRAIVTG
ncbi:hypothetical protein RA993_23085, partial [Mycobacteroides abscessus subsp. abscessus]|uniref:hypothetical protein n=1 Tax=Mycobacteroides abscessus TaxID=36809 RepID=UPI003CEAE3BB